MFKNIYCTNSVIVKNCKQLVSTNKENEYTVKSLSDNSIKKWTRATLTDVEKGPNLYLDG